MKVGREGILGEILKEILGEILEKHVLKSIRRRRILEGGRVGGVSPPKVRAGVMVRQVDSNTRHPILRWKSFLGKRSWGQDSDFDR